MKTQTNLGRGSLGSFLRGLVAGLRRERRPFPLFEVTSEEEGHLVAREYERRYGLDHDILIIHIPEGEEGGIAPSGAEFLSKQHYQ